MAKFLVEFEDKSSLEVNAPDEKAAERHAIKVSDSSAAVKSVKKLKD
jgi:hypothetical protein